MGQAASGSPDMLLGASELNDGANYATTCPAGPYEFSQGDVNRQCDLFHFWSLHQGGSHFAHADGSVHFYDYAISPALIPALATFAGGEVEKFFNSSDFEEMEAGRRCSSSSVLVPSYGWFRRLFLLPTSDQMRLSRSFALPEIRPPGNSPSRKFALPEIRPPGIHSYVNLCESMLHLKIWCSKT